MKTLSEKNALITGGGSGIGRAIALALAAQGVGLWLAGRDSVKLEAVAAAARRLGGRACWSRTDLAREEDLVGLAARLREDLDNVDLLIHSAGEIKLAPLESASIGDLDRQYQVNVRAPYLLCQLLLPMIRSAKGQIVFINSSAGQAAAPKMSQYAATKHALRAIADSLRHEVNAAGVRVLTVYPGRTASPMQAAVHDMEGKPYHPERLLQPEDVAGLVLNALSLPSTAEVTDIHVRPLQKSQ